MKSKARLCGCVTDLAHTEQLGLYLQHPEIDILEWRLDSFIRRHSPESILAALPVLSLSPRHTVLVTNRPKREGGAFEGPEDFRIDVLLKAVSQGAEWVDLEDDVPRSVLDKFKSENARVLLSRHDFTGTPSRPALQHLAEKMAKKGTDAIKIVTYAHSSQDNLRVLDLIAFGRRELGKDVISFCMGPQGRWSRFACLLLGSPWTYVQLPGQPAAAPGQFTAAEMRILLDIMLRV